MSNPHDYRQLASKQRLLAELASLPNVRTMHINAAYRLDEIASELERSATMRSQRTLRPPVPVNQLSTMSA